LGFEAGLSLTSESNNFDTDSDSNADTYTDANYRMISSSATAIGGWTCARTAALRDHQIQLEPRLSRSEAASWKKSRW